MLSKKIGIDLGTATVVVYVKGEGVVVNEPTLIVTDEKGARVLAVGSAAAELRARSSAGRVVRPVKNGASIDYNVAAVILNHVIGRVIGRQRIFRPDVMLAVPSTVTGVERRTVLEATMQAGARTAYLIEKPLAAALGANLPLASTRGVAVCNLGAGSTEVAVLAMGETVALASAPVGGRALDRAIAGAVLARHGVRLDEREAERLKIAIGSALPGLDGASGSASGTNVAGQAATAVVTADEVHDALRGPLDEIADLLIRALEQVPETVRSPLQAGGLVLTGGAAQLAGMASFLTERTGLPSRTAPNPQTCVAIGTGVALENLQVIRRGQPYIT